MAKKEDFDKLVKTQLSIWIITILFVSGYALFAKLVWTHKFPILIFLPMLMIGFALASINSMKAAFSKLIDDDDAAPE